MARPERASTRTRRSRRASAATRAQARMAAEIAQLRAEVAELRRRLERRSARKPPDTEHSWQRWMPRFLKVLRASGGNASTAIDAVSVSRSTVYDHKQRCPAFSEAWDAVLRELAQEEGGTP